MGFVKNVNSSLNKCDIIRLGYFDYTYIGLANIGDPVFLATDGGVTQTKPISGYLQFLGFCNEANKIFVDVQMHRIKLQ